MTPPSIEPQAAENGWEGAEGEPKRPRATSRTRDAVLALSISHFCFIQSWHGLLFERDFGYYNRIPVNRASLAALLINIFGLAVVLWLAGRSARRWNVRGLWIAAHVAVCALALVPLNFARTHFWHLTGAKFGALLKEPLMIAVVLAGVAALIWLHRYAARAVMVIYIILSPAVLFTAGKCAWWMVAPPPAVVEAKGGSAGRLALPGEPRIVWILLDELDQRIGFEARPAGIEMPELSRFYWEGLRATNAFPPGGSTLYSLPSLTIGREVRHARPASASELALTLAGMSGAVGWSRTENVFARARALGFTTALVGWYHPYGRVLGRDLDRCEWGAYPPFEEERGFTVGEAMRNQMAAVLSQFQQRRLHIELFREAQAASLSFLTNAPAGLTLLHLPVPHHPGIYDPKRDELTVWNYARQRGYLENLTLADRLFGQLRRAMEQAGTWDTAWVLVSSDHWWREATTIDHRVPFILKGPGQNEAMLYGQRFNTMVTYHLVLSVLKGEVTNLAQMPQWLDTHRQDPPSGYKPAGEPF